ncbi:MAG: carbon storage regulator [Pirellulales bacterium]|nr:carbon storage regulator [Pirellulales bacterium]
MLVLTRKSQDSIRIGDHIKVTVLRIKGNTVRIGVEAPEDVRIVRGELPHFGDPSENSGNSIEVAAIREPAVGLGVEPAAADTGSNQDVAERGAASRMPTSSRQKPYMPARTNKDTQRSHPISGNRLPSENISVSGTGLPLPPR